MPQVTLTFDTDNLALAAIYETLLGLSRPVQKVSEPSQKASEPDRSGLIPSDVQDQGKPSHTAKTPGQDAATVKANRQASAQKAREAAAAKKAAEQAAAAKAGIVGLGPIDGGDHSEDLNGADDDDDIGLTDPGMSPGEARDAGLALVREAYAAGHVAPVKVLQKAWGVSKFYDVPVEKGNEFYQQAMKLAQETGIRR